MQAQQLRAIPLFSALNEEQLAQIQAMGQVRQLSTGENLFQQMESAQQFFCLRSGLLKLYRISPMGEEKIIEFVRPGIVFAEAIMFHPQPWRFPVSAQMIEEGEVWCFSNQLMIDLLRASPDTCFRLLGSLSRRLHQQVNEIDRLTLQTATDRVINYLLQHTENQGDQVKLLTNKQTLAAHLSIKPETLSRIFAKLCREELIQVEGTYITLLNKTVLKDKITC